MRDRTLARQALAEFVGTALLVAAVVGSGIAAQRLSPHDVGLELLENTVATAAALVAIIFAVGPVSGAHLNPVITLVDRFFGGTRTAAAATYVVAQFAGGAVGAVVANTMFGLRVVALSTHHRATGPHLFSEAVATFGLVLVVFGVVRAGRGPVGALRGGCLHRCRLLVHVLDELRQPGRDAGPHAVGLLRRDRARPRCPASSPSSSWVGRSGRPASPCSIPGCATTPARSCSHHEEAA